MTSQGYPSMTPIYAKNGYVQIRFVCQQVSQEEYDSWYKFHSAYKLIKKEGTLRHPKCLLLSKTSETQEFINSYLARNGKFKCDKCKDAAVWHDDNSKWHYCDCEFGKLVKKYF